MNDNERPALEWERALDRLAAEVATTAYAIALRHGAGGSWLDLELGLWKALAQTLREWDRLLSGPRAEGPFPATVETVTSRRHRPAPGKGVSNEL
jgi:hypothetical protein